MLIKCNQCGKMLNVVKNSSCETICCGVPMTEIISNSVDAAFEKHIPSYEVRGNRIIVKVNHVMEEEHFIEWIGMESEKRIERVFLKAGNFPEAEFEYIPGSTIYSYCNKHGLWENKVV